MGSQETHLAASDRVAALVAAAQAGDRSAFTALAGLLNRQVAAVVTAELLCGPEELQDVLQDIWLAAWQSLPRLREPARFTPWLYAVARNRTRTFRQRYRREQQRRQEPDPGQGRDDDPLAELPAAAGSDPAVAVGGKHLLTAALGQLPPKERLAFFLRVVIEPPWEFADISRALGAGEVAARVAYSRACKRLATWWKAEFA